MLRKHSVILKTIIKILLIGVYTLFHLLILREVRTHLFEYQVNEQFVQQISDSEELSFNKLDSRLFYIDYNSPDTQQTWRYKVSFGSFFFMGMIGLILIGASLIHFYILIGGHGIMLVLSLILLKLNPMNHLWPLVVLDLGTHYLLPLLSIGIIPISIVEKKKNR